LTEHLEGDADASSSEIFQTAAELVQVADALGFCYAWFAEHHAHVHRGHLPTPLLLAVHLAAKTTNIALGTGVICLNQHRAIDVAEQVAVADVLTGGRLAIGFGSGSTPLEAVMFGLPEISEHQRHQRFDDSLLSIERRWAGKVDGVETPSFRPLPKPAPDLMRRCWSAANSTGAATVAGWHGLNIMFSHLRTAAQYQSYAHAYRAAGGRGRIAANRPVILGETGAQAAEIGENAVRRLWRRFRAEGKIGNDIREPDSLAEVCAHPLNFIIGGPSTVATEILALHDASPFDVLNVEVTWDGLTAADSQRTLRLLVAEVMPILRATKITGCCEQITPSPLSI
jgi:alkanesulfonate monooxygenase SsuD/methylene tetrahydromethanopterin reductase-like flavin-dependent oxidoreductase (luciferase family)